MKAPFNSYGLGVPAAWLRRLTPVSLAVVAACLVSAPGARADTIVTFVLDAVQFLDGGTATGSFAIDENTGYVFNGNVTVTDAHSAASPDMFNNATVTSEYDASNLNFNIFNNLGDGLVLNFQNVLGATSDAVSSGYYTYNGGSRTSVTSGSVDVPEPATVPLLGAALGLVLFTRKAFRRPITASTDFA